VSKTEPTQPLTLQRRIVIALVGGVVFGVLAALYVFFSAPVYRAHAKIFLPIDATVTAMQVPVLGVMEDAATPLSLVAGVMKSESFFRKVSAASGQSYRDVMDDLTVEPASATNQIAVKYPSKDKDTAMKVVAESLKVLRAMNADLGQRAAQQKASTLAPTIEARQRELDTIGTKVAKALEELKVPVNIEDPTKTLALLDAIKDARLELTAVVARRDAIQDQAQASARGSLDLPAQLGISPETRARITAARLELDKARLARGDEDPTVVTLKEELRLAEEAGRKESNDRLEAVSSGLDRSVSDLEATRISLEKRLSEVEKLWAGAPQKAITLSTLRSEFTVMGLIISDLRRRYEQAQAEALTEQVPWVVLDEPFIEDRPINKRFTSTIAIWFIAGSLLVFFGAPFLPKRKS
jgi:uncharacterized protein involved in exopolysaccharide biosynthesis